jgi:hypothetical protein
MQKGVILGCGNRSNVGMDTVTLDIEVRYKILQLEHRIKKSCTWGYKHALVIPGLKLGQFRNLGG